MEYATIIAQRVLRRQISSGKSHFNISKMVDAQKCSCVVLFLNPLSYFHMLPDIAEADVRVSES